MGGFPPFLGPPTPNPANGTPTQQTGQGGKPATYSNGMYQLVRTNPAVARSESGPAIRIGPNDVVTIAPIFTNTLNCFVNVNGMPDAAQNAGPRFTIPPGANPRVVKVRNLSDIWMFTTGPVGEGIIIDVQFAGN